VRVAVGDAELVVSAHRSARRIRSRHPSNDRSDFGLRLRLTRGEHADPAIVTVRNAIEFLLEDGPSSYVTRQQERLAAAGRCSKGYATRREPLIGEGAQMSPASQLDLTGRIGIALLVVPGVLNLPKQQRQIVNANIDSETVALLRIIGSGPALVAIEDRAQNRQAFADVDEQPRRRRGWRHRPGDTKDICGPSGARI
jgi:hypothetical protein